MKQIKVIVEKHSDGYVAYPLGLKGVGPLHDRLDVAQISRVAIAACGDEASHYG